MSEAPEKRRHHYAPIHYLKNFCDDTGVLHVISVQDGRRWEGIPDSVGFERDLYRLENPGDGVRPDALEDAFAKFEAEGAPVIDELILTRVMPTEDEALSKLYNFLAFSFIRLPSTRRLISEPIKQTRRIISGMLVHSRANFEHQMRQAGIPFTEGDYEKTKEAVESGRVDPHVSTEEYFKYAVGMMDTILKFLPRRIWSILHTDRPGEHFVTSDHPLSLTWSDGRRHGMYPPGHGHEKTDLIMPLGSHVALFGRYVDYCPPVSEITTHNLAAVNLKTILYSGRFIAGCSDDFVVGGKAGEPIRGANDVIQDIRNRNVKPPDAAARPGSRRKR